MATSRRGQPTTRPTNPPPSRRGRNNNDEEQSPVVPSPTNERVPGTPASQTLGPTRVARDLEPVRPNITTDPTRTIPLPGGDQAHYRANAERGLIRQPPAPVMPRPRPQDHMFDQRPVAPWMRGTYEAPQAPEQIAVVPKTQWDAQAVRAQNPEFVSYLREAIKARIASMPADQYGPFEQMAVQNPEGAASSIAARFLDTLRPFEEQLPPTLDVALRSRLRSSELWNWLHWQRDVRNGNG